MSIGFVSKSLRGLRWNILTWASAGGVVQRHVFGIVGQGLFLEEEGIDSVMSSHCLGSLDFTKKG